MLLGSQTRLARSAKRRMNTPSLDLRLNLAEFDSRIGIARASIATVEDHLRTVWNVKSGEPRLFGARRVENRVTASEDLAGPAWTRTNLNRVERNAHISPIGTLDADTLVEDATATAVHSILQPMTTWVVGETYTISVYVKPAGRHWLLLNADTMGRGSNFDIQAGVVGAPNGAIVSASIQDAPNGYKRCSFTFVATGTSGSARLYMGNADGPSGHLYSGDNASGMHVWGFQVERGTAASEYVSNGALIGAAGPNSVVNGDFNSTILGWTDASSGGGTFVHAGGVTGGALFTGGAGTAAGRQAQTTVANQRRRVRCTLHTVSGGSGSFSVGTSAGGTQLLAAQTVGAGTHEFTYMPTGTTSWLNFSAGAGVSFVLDDVTDVDISNAGLYHGARVEGVKLFSTFADGTPIPSPIGLLVEGAATNLALRSKEFANAAWTKSNLTATDNTFASPSGATDAATLAATAANATILQSITSASAARAGSIWLRRKTGTGNVDLTLDGGSTWTTVALSTAQWTRVWIPQTLANPSFGVRIVTSGDEVYAWEAQVESDTRPSSNITTTSAQVTRTAESATLDGVPLGTSNTAIVEFVPDELAATRGIFSIESVASPAQNYVGCRTSGQVNVVSGNVTQATIAGSTLTAGAVNKVALHFEAGAAGSTSNGLASVTGTPAAMPVGADRLSLGAIGGASHGNVIISRFRLFPRILTETVRRAATGAASYTPTLDIDLTSAFGIDPRITHTRATTATVADHLGTVNLAKVGEVRVEGMRRIENLLTGTEVLSTQSVTVAARVYTLAHEGTGTITLSGAASGTLVGDGTRKSLTFTPSAGSLTLTVTGSVTRTQLETGRVASEYVRDIDHGWRAAGVRCFTNYRPINLVRASANLGDTAQWDYSSATVSLFAEADGFLVTVVSGSGTRALRQLIIPAVPGAVYTLQYKLRAGSSATAEATVTNGTILRHRTAAGAGTASIASGAARTADLDANWTTAEVVLLATGDTLTLNVFPSTGLSLNDSVRVKEPMIERGAVRNVYVPTLAGPKAADYTVPITDRRGNLHIWSDAYSNAAWTKTDTTVTTANALWSGSVPLHLLTEGSAGTAQVLNASGVTVAASREHTASRIVSRGNHDWVLLAVLDSAGSHGARAWFNLATGAKGATAAVGSGTVIDSRITDLGSGVYRISVTGTISTNTSAISRLRSASADSSTTHVNGATRYEGAAQLVPGFVPGDYVPTDASAITDFMMRPQGAVIEESSTNHALHARDLANAAWAKSSATAVADAAGVFGPGASTLTATGANGTCLQAITRTSTARVTSAYVRRKTGTGTVEMTQNNGSTWTAIAISSQWGRYAIPSATLADPTIGFRIVTSGDAIEVDLVSHEEKVEATTAIATTTVAVTRNVDAGTLADLNKGWWNGREHAIVIEGKRNGAANASAQQQWIDFNDATTNNRIGLAVNSTPLERLFVVAGGTTLADIASGGGQAGRMHRVAAGVRAGLHAVSGNGAAVGTGSNATPLPAVTQATLGNRSDGARSLNGTLRRIQIHAVRPANDAVAQMSA